MTHAPLGKDLRSTLEEHKSPVTASTSSKAVELIASDRLVERVFELRGEGGVDFGLLDREIVSVFAICLRLVDGIGYVLFLRIVLILIGCVCVGLVLFEVADELRVNTDRASMRL